MKKHNTTGITKIAYPKLAKELENAKIIGILLSGGCDSEVLLRASVDVLGEKNTKAFHANTPFIAEFYGSIVKRTAEQLNTELFVINLNPLQIKNITANTTERCYHCKKAIYSNIQKVATTHKISILADGTNLDDLNEYRPGTKAAKELQILQPFLNANMTKKNIRHLAFLLNMPNPDRPSDSCLATRVLTYTTINKNIISLINNIEAPLRPHVKGRLRARITNEGIILEFQAIDKKLVSNNKEILKSIAYSKETKIIFKEIVTRPTAKHPCQTTP